MARREPRADTAATAVVVFAVTKVDYIIVLSVLFARRDRRFHSLSHRGKSRRAALGERPCRDGRAEEHSERVGAHPLPQRLR